MTNGQLWYLYYLMSSMEESQCIKAKTGEKSETRVRVVTLRRWMITRVWLFLYSSLYFKHFLNKMCMTLQMVGEGQ